MIEFKLTGQDFIQLNNLLKLLNLVQTGGEANQLISAGAVKVNGKVENQKRKKLVTGDEVEFETHKIKII